MSILIGVVLIIILIGVSIAIGNRRMNQMVQAEVDGIFKDAIFKDGADQPARTFSEADVAHLPEPVQRYLKHVLKPGQPYIHCARLKQSGAMCLAPGQSWRPFTAVQYFTTNPPAFIWYARMSLMPLVWVAARDKYARQQGNMLIKPHSIFTLINASGPELTRASFIRFLAEAMWFPTALIDSPYLQWEAIDTHSARALVDDQGVKATLTFYFDDAGDLTKIESIDRFKDEGDTQPTLWFGQIKQYKEFHGVCIPSEAEVCWELETGDFAYWRGTITEVDYNVPRLY